MINHDFKISGVSPRASSSLRCSYCGMLYVPTIKHVCFSPTPAAPPAENNAVNHPEHYQSEDGIECIDAIRAALTPEEFLGFCKGNTLKYVWRERKKGNRAQDVSKAVWYLGMVKEHV